MYLVRISDSDNNLIFAIHVPKQAEIASSQLLRIAVGSLSPAAEFAAAQAGSKEGTKYRWSAWKPPKPWLTSAAVYSLCSEKLLASSSSSHMCQGAGTPDMGTQSPADKHTQLAGYFCSDPGTVSDFWTLL